MLKKRNGGKEKTIKYRLTGKKKLKEEETEDENEIDMEERRKGKR